MRKVEPYFIDVSVVIIGRNEGARLERCIESVQRMDFKKDRFEILYVDSNSSDNSVEIAKGLRVKVIKIIPKHPCAAIARNSGMRRVKGQFILFLDGDTILDSKFVRYAMKEFENLNIAAVWGHRREIHPRRSIYNRVLDLDWIAKPGYVNFCGGDVLIRRSVMEEIGGYNEELIAGEDPEMCRRVVAKGYHVLHVDYLMTKHDLAITCLFQYWRRALRTGHAYAEVSHRFSLENDPMWKLESCHNIRHIIVLCIVSIGVALFASIYKELYFLLLFSLFYLILILRSAFRFQWKSPNSFQTCIFYGIHSYFQQIPIFIGQLVFWKNYFLGKRKELIEYK